MEFKFILFAKSFIFSFRWSWNIFIDLTFGREKIKIGYYSALLISLIVSGRYPENPAIWLVPGAGSIFLSPDHGHGNQLR